MLHSSAAQTSEDHPDSWSPFRSQSTLSQVELHGLQELHFLKQNHDLVAQDGGEIGGGTIRGLRHVSVHRSGFSASNRRRFRLTSGEAVTGIGLFKKV
jgi:hypothetical protein